MTKTNPFSYKIHDSCIVEVCTKMTQHKSGYCSECRTKKCVGCDRVIVLSNTFDIMRPFCGECKSKHRRRVG